MHLDNMEQIQKRVLEDMDLSEENDDARLREKIEEKVWEHGKCHLISLEEEQRYVQEIFCSLRKLDVLEELLQDESVTEIMVNGYIWFVDSKQYEETYPDAKLSVFEIQIKFKYQPSDFCIQYLSHVNDKLSSMNISVEYEVTE